MATRETPNPTLLSALRAEADAEGRVCWATFSRIALYHETAGYYRRDRQRVGKTAEADFYTSVSVGPVFGMLIAAAARQLISPANPADFTLAEIGAETQGGMFTGVDTGFGAVKTFLLGDEFSPESNTVLVANEVLDAQPFHRFVFHQDRWREMGVEVSTDTLREVPLDDWTDEAKNQLIGALAASSLEGYRLDLALAENLVHGWARGN